MNKMTRIFLISFLCLGLGGLLLSLTDVKLPENMKEFRHVNTLVVPDKESPIHGIHHFYLSETGMETFMSMEEGKTYPNGTVFIGKVFKVTETDEGRYKEGDMAGITMMRKDSGSEMTKDTGGWHFVMFSPKGEAKDIDPVKACFQCHKPHEESDFVLSKPLGK